LYCRIYCRVAAPAENVSASKALLVLLVGGACWVLWLQLVLRREVVLSAAVRWGAVDPVPCFRGSKVGQCLWVPFVVAPSVWRKKE